MRHNKIVFVALFAHFFFGVIAIAEIPEDAILIDREITEVLIEGLEKVDEGLVRNNIRLQVGDPYDPEIIKSDTRTLNRLGVFENFDISIEPLQDGRLRLIYQFKEHPIITDVKFVGNKLIATSELRSAIPIRPGGVRDNFLIDKSLEVIEEVYRSRGYYLATVLIEASSQGIDGPLVFKVIEGPRVRIQSLVFKGNRAFTNAQLESEIDTETALFLIRRGELNRNTLDQDIAKLNKYYRDRGYLDIRVDYRVDVGPKDQEAKVIFLISEGPLYRLRKIKIGNLSSNLEPYELDRNLKVLSEEQIAALMVIQPGDPFSAPLIEQSKSEIESAYGNMGYVGTKARLSSVRPGNIGQVDLIVSIVEGDRADVGVVSIAGNSVSKENIIRRHIGLKPGRPINGDEIKETEDRIKRTRLFSDAKVRLLSDPARPSIRDILVEVKETRTGNLGFGVGFGSDSGAFGQISYRQNNFDINDFPETLGEFFAGRSFIGGGQKFSAFLMPGTDVFNYGLSLTEPYLLESRYSLSGSLGSYRRQYSEYDEERDQGSISIARRFGDIWKGSFSVSLQDVRLSDFESTVPDQVRLGAGPDFVESMGFKLSRNTIKSLGRPDSGSNFEVQLDHFGGLGGDYEFNQLQLEGTTYFALSRDFLGRPSTLRLKSRMGYNFSGNTPTYERFYLGGSSFRGFDYREISPRGTIASGGTTIVTDRSIGGDWLFFIGAQYETPFVGDTISFVGFLDSGTVNASPGFDSYRMSIGCGVRLYVPAFGSAPIAFDFGFPVSKEDSDDQRVFNFTAELPF